MDVPLVCFEGFSQHTSRGFTDHEHLDEVELIHMNGRVYDYNLGRFLSVDPFIQEPGNSQSMNPYSYLLNNPLGGTDPSGYAGEDEKNAASNEFTVTSEARTGSRIKQKHKVVVTVSGGGKSGLLVNVSGSNGGAIKQAVGEIAG